MPIGNICCLICDQVLEDDINKYSKSAKVTLYI